MNRPFVIAMTGASGAIYGRRLLSALLAGGHEVHAVFSTSALTVIHQELGIAVRDPLTQPDLKWLLGDEVDVLRGRMSAAPFPPTGLAICHDVRSFMAPIASGSFLSGGMVICPCSGSTLSAIASGASTNLIHRAADVQIKEKRRLIVVPRETPVSLVHLDNMRRLCELGAVVMPAMPGWYHGVQSPLDLVDFMVARILDHLDVPHSLLQRWGENPAEPHK